MELKLTQKQNQTLFTKQEAEALVGKEVITRVEFSGVVKQTRGVVLKPSPNDYTSDGKYVRSVPVQWIQPERRGKPLVDWFTKYEFEKFLELTTIRYGRDTLTHSI